MARRVAAVAVLVALVFAQRPGRLVGDTKLDLTADPARFLARALTAWLPTHQGGELQNQAVGYLLPMGAFHLAGVTAGLPGWVVQRLWLTVLLVVAYLGADLVAGRLGVGRGWGRVAAAAASLATPGVLGLAQTNTAELLPQLLLPWLVLPLLRWGADRPVVAAAVGGLAVGLTGGVNASALLLVLPVVALAVLLAPMSGRDDVLLGRRLRLLAGWAVAVLATTVWWSGPLVVLGRYGFDFLPYTESAATTTLTTGLSDVLHGTERWVEHLVVNGYPSRPVAAALESNPVGVLAVGGLVVAGVFGLLRARPGPARRFLVASVVVGLVVIGAGHRTAGGVGEPLGAGALWSLLDGPLAPLRNLAKADALVRLPLAVGVGLLVARWEPALRPSRVVVRRRVARAGAAAVALGLVAVSGFALSPGLAADSGYAGLPAYWRDAGRWLDDRAGPGSVLVEPASAFGEFAWGRPLDEPLQAVLADRPWLARAQQAAGSAGITRVLAAVDDAVVAGDGGPALRAALARLGVRWVLTRTDLDPFRTRPVWPEQVTQALTDAGLVPVASFGPDIGTRPRAGAVTTQGLGQPRPALTVWSTGVDTPLVTRTPVAGLVRVDGAPEDVSRAASDLGATPTVLAGDPGSGLAGSGVLTDGLRRRELAFGPFRETPVTLAADQPYVLDRPAHDVLEPDWSTPPVVADTGAVTVTASSSLADPGVAVDASPQDLPAAAADGVATTAWVSAPGAATAQWWQATWASAWSAPTVTVTPAIRPGTTATPARLRVTTDAGSVDVSVGADGAPVTVTLPPGPTRTLRVGVVALAAGEVDGASVGLTEVGAPGLPLVRRLDVRATAAVRDVRLTRAGPAAAPCAEGDVGGWLCGALLATGSEETAGLFRRVTLTDPLTDPLTGPLTGQAVPTDAARAAVLAALGRDWQVQASSQVTTAAPGWAAAAFDGDPATSWFADPGDTRPTLTVGVPEPATVTGVRVDTPTPGVGRTIEDVEVTAGGVSRAGRLGSDGTLRFAPLTGTVFTVRFAGPPETGDGRSLASYAVSGLDLLGVAAPTPPADSEVVSLPCGQGPAVTVAGVDVPTAVTTTVGRLRTGRPVPFRACGPVTLAAGPTTVDAADGAWRVSALEVGTLAAPGPAVAPAVTSWGDTSRRVEVASAGSASLLVTTENLNAGWTATLDGELLHPVRIDGWRQAWVVPAGRAGVVELEFGPAHTATIALVVGGLAILLVAGVALVAGRRPVRPAPGRDRPVGRSVRRRRWSTAATAVTLVAVPTVLGSGVGLVVGVVAAAVVVAARGRRGAVVRRVALVVVGGALVAEVLVATGAALVGRLGDPLDPATVDVVRQVLVLVAVAAAGVSLTGTATAPDPRPADA